jgi:hypothetical protein
MYINVMNIHFARKLCGGSCRSLFPEKGAFLYLGSHVWATCALESSRSCSYFLLRILHSVISHILHRHIMQQVLWLEISMCSQLMMRGRQVGRRLFVDKMY